MPTAHRLRWVLLRTYEDDRAAFNLHSVGAVTPRGLDCTHWLTPGVPDVWAAKLVGLLLKKAIGREGGAAV